MPAIRKTAEAEDDEDRKVIADVAEYGWLDAMHDIINVLGDAIKAGTSFTTEGEHDLFENGYSYAFCTVDEQFYEEYLGYARWFFKGDDFPAMQLVWPDRMHRFPWQSDFEEALRQHQPLLCQTSYYASATNNTGLRLARMKSNDSGEEGTPDACF